MFLWPVVQLAAISVGNVRIVKPEAANYAVRAGETFGIPLYDGDIVWSNEWHGTFQYLRTITVPTMQILRENGAVVSSRRLALFRATGPPGSGATIQVRLRLLELHEQCTSCRVVHFMVRIQ